jgi:hypothetical protein
VFGCISVVVVKGACVRDCRGLGLCTLGPSRLVSHGECVGGRGCVVTGWGRIGGIGKDQLREWMRKVRNSSWEVEQWILSQ